MDADSFSGSGDEKRFDAGTDDLIVLLYGELRKIAHREHFRAGMPQTLQTTALIGEAYVRLKRREGWEGPAHFLGCAATAMRHVLIDAARARLTAKRRAAWRGAWEGGRSGGIGDGCRTVVRHLGLRGTGGECGDAGGEQEADFH